jgi:tripartite-type tricarboxylate transporter receptor subunit TctC
MNMMKTRPPAMKAMLTLLGLTAAMLLPVLPAQAQGFPTKPVRILTPFPPGSGPDAALRLVADSLSRKWGQPVVVENKAGGNGFIAITSFKQSAGTDGYQLIQLDNNHVTTHPHTFSKLPFDAEKDFTPLSMILRTNFFVAVAADSPYKTLDDIIAAARANPGKINYGSWFVGSPGHMGALKLESMVDVKMTHVPFRDFGQLYAAVANKEVDWALGSIASAGGLERAGKLRFIALAAPKRDPLYPNVPSTAESVSSKGFEIKGWTGLYGPRGLPEALRDQLAANIAEAVAAPEVMERYRTLGFETPTYSPLELSALIRRESSEWAVVIKKANLKLD